jgi:hypothetical protein
MRVYVMRGSLISRLKESPCCETCGKSIKKGEEVVATRGRRKTHFRHKECYERLFLVVSNGKY